MSYFNICWNVCKGERENASFYSEKELDLKKDNACDLIKETNYTIESSLNEINNNLFINSENKIDTIMSENKNKNDKSKGFKIKEIKVNTKLFRRKKNIKKIIKDSNINNHQVIPSTLMQERNCSIDLQSTRKNSHCSDTNKIDHKISFEIKKCDKKNDNKSCIYCEDIYKSIILYNKTEMISYCYFCRNKINRDSLYFYVDKYKDDIAYQKSKLLKLNKDKVNKVDIMPPNRINKDENVFTFGNNLNKLKPDINFKFVKYTPEEIRKRLGIKLPEFNHKLTSEDIKKRKEKLKNYTKVKKNLNLEANRISFNKIRLL
jgi:hypothetical protein